MLAANNGAAASKSIRHDTSIANRLIRAPLSLLCTCIETGAQFASASLIGKLASVLEVSPAQLFGDYKHEVNYEQAKATANATVDVLRNVLDGKFSALYGQLNEIENLLQTKQNGFPPPGSGLTLPM